ncbi:hypothetical protein TorRG33x02_276590, partial [Trema orientale]
RKAPSSSSSWDNKKFVSAAANARYNAGMLNKEGDSRKGIRAQSWGFPRVSSYRQQQRMDDEFHEYAASIESLDEVTTTIAHSGAEWTLLGTTPRSLKTKNLKNDAQAWNYFIQDRFMPSKHLSDVTKYRAILMHYIMKGNSIYAGELLSPITW